MLVMKRELKTETERQTKEFCSLVALAAAGVAALGLMGPSWGCTQPQAAPRGPWWDLITAASPKEGQEAIRDSDAVSMAPLATLHLTTYCPDNTGEQMLRPLWSPPPAGSPATGT